jgi:hypothetical protein
LYIRMQAQPHLLSGVLVTEDTITATCAEAQQAMPEIAQEVHKVAEHTKGMGEHTASTAHVH